MLSVEVGKAILSKWLYADEPGQTIRQYAALMSEQWDGEGEADEDPISIGEITLFVAQNVDDEGDQDLLTMVMDEADELDFVEGMAKFIFIVDDGLKIMVEASNELHPTRPLFPMSRQLIALLTVARKITAVYTMSDGGRRFAVFNAAVPLVWELEAD
jgi:hypothetical protein